MLIFSFLELKFEHRDRITYKARERQRLCLSPSERRSRRRKSVSLHASSLSWCFAPNSQTLQKNMCNQLLLRNTTLTDLRLGSNKKALPANANHLDFKKMIICTNHLKEKKKKMWQKLAMNNSRYIISCSPQSLVWKWVQTPLPHTAPSPRFTVKGIPFLDLLCPQAADSLFLFSHSFDFTPPPYPVPNPATSCSPLP